MLSATPCLIVPKSPRSTSLITQSQGIFPKIWKGSHQGGAFKSAAHELLANTPVKQIARHQTLLFVEETDTVRHVLNQFKRAKTSFAVVMSNGKPIGTCDVLDLFQHCNNKITNGTIPFEELRAKMEAMKHDFSNATLDQIVVFQTSAKQNWYYRTIPASRSVLHLIHILCAHPNLRKVPLLDDAGQVIGILEVEDVLRFILDNDKSFAHLIKRPIGDLNFQRQNLASVKASRDHMMNLAFKVMWQKEIKGLLGCSNGSSILDLFFNYVHYVISGFEICPSESELVGQMLVTSPVEDVMDLILTENLDSVYVIDRQPKRIIGVLTVTELLASFC